MKRKQVNGVKSRKASFGPRQILSSVIIVVATVLTISFIQPPQTVQAQTQTVPNPGCLGSCPTIPVTPTTDPYAPPVLPTAGAYPPTSMATSGALPSTLCATNKYGKYKKKHKKKRQGSIDKFMYMILLYIMQLIEQMNKGAGGTLPVFPTDPCATVGGLTPVMSPALYPTIDPASPTVDPAIPAVTIPVATTPGGITPIGITPGASISAGCTQADIQALVNSVSQANLEANLRALVQDDSKPKPNELISRHISSPGNQIKVDWAKQKMASYGLQIIDQPFTSGGHSLNNVVARINGSTPNSLLAVGGHIDAINNGSDGAYLPNLAAPGAEDDGSGVVVAMEAGRVLKGFERCLKSSIDVVAWNDEEAEMNGSSTYVKSLSGKTFKGAISMDMIGYTPSGECLKSAVSKGIDATLSQKVVDMNAKYNIGLNVTTAASDSDMGDDASNFWKANLPAAYVLDCSTEKDAGAYPGYHKPTDTVNNINFTQLVKTTKLVVAALAELAIQ